MALIAPHVFVGAFQLELRLVMVERPDGIPGLGNVAGFAGHICGVGIGVAIIAGY